MAATSLKLIVINLENYLFCKDQVEVKLITFANFREVQI